MFYIDQCDIDCIVSEVSEFKTYPSESFSFFISICLP